jgi:hypothetical protein
LCSRQSQTDFSPDRESSTRQFDPNTSERESGLHTERVEKINDSHEK